CRSRPSPAPLQAVAWYGQVGTARRGKPQLALPRTAQHRAAAGWRSLVAHRRRLGWELLFGWLEQPANRQFLTGVPLLAGGLLVAAAVLGWLRDYAGDLAWCVTAD